MSSSPYTSLTITGGIGDDIGCPLIFPFARVLSPVEGDDLERNEYEEAPDMPAVALVLELGPALPLPLPLALVGLFESSLGMALIRASLHRLRSESCSWRDKRGGNAVKRFDLRFELA